MRQAVFGNKLTWFLVTNCRIVNHRIESAKRIHLLRNVSRLLDARQIADNNTLALWHGSLRLVSSCFISRMQHNFVALLDQKLRCHLAQPIR
jgi:hypothetical protein